MYVLNVIQVIKKINAYIHTYVQTYIPNYYKQKVRIDLLVRLHEFGARIPKQFEIGRPILAMRFTDVLCVERKEYADVLVRSCGTPKARLFVRGTSLPCLRINCCVVSMLKAFGVSKTKNLRCACVRRSARVCK